MNNALWVFDKTSTSYITLVISNCQFHLWNGRKKEEANAAWLEQLGKYPLGYQIAILDDAISAPPLKNIPDEDVVMEAYSDLLFEKMRTYQDTENVILEMQQKANPMMHIKERREVASEFGKIITEEKSQQNLEWLCLAAAITGTQESREWKEFWSRKNYLGCKESEFYYNRRAEKHAFEWGMTEHHYLYDSLSDDKKRLESNIPYYAKGIFDGCKRYDV